MTLTKDMLELEYQQRLIERLKEEVKEKKLSEGGSEETTPFNPKKITPRHELVLSLYIQGLDRQTICDITGYSYSYLSILINSETFQDVALGMRTEIASRFTHKIAEDRATDPVIQKIRDNAMKALDTQLELLGEAESETVRQKAATDLLDRAGYGSTQKVETSQNITLEDKVQKNLSVALEQVMAMTGGKKNGSSLPD